MSQWTHFLGVIRYDSLAAVVWPVPENKTEVLIDELQLVKTVYSVNIPEGSEGPLELNFINTNRGPTITISGDLRDFGKPELIQVLAWVSERYEIVQTLVMKQKRLLMMRDAVIRCEVESDKTTYLIEFTNEGILDPKKHHGFLLREYQEGSTLIWNQGGNNEGNG